jgi:hypothetical protein
MRSSKVQGVNMTINLGAGLPAGLQLLGRPFDEGTLFRIAYAYEQVTQHRRPSPIFPELQSTSSGIQAQSLVSQIASVPLSG